MASSTDISKLTRKQREYFSILEGMEPSAKLKRAIEAAKRDLIAQANRSEEDSEAIEAEPAQAEVLRYSGEDREALLRILLDEEEEGGYYARLSDLATGSISDRSGSTVAEAVEASLSWIGVEGLKLDPEATVAEIRSALAEASESADFELTVQLYTSF